MGDLSRIVKLMLAELKQQGVTLTQSDVTANPPKFSVVLHKKSLIQSETDTLNSVYGILWVLANGKLTKENNNRRIDLNYKVVEGSIED